MSDPAVMPIRRAGLLVATLGDEVVVHDPAASRSWRLNRTAGIILDRCDGRTDVAQVVTELAAAFGVDPGQVGRQVTTALGSFAADGLVPGPDGDDAAPPGRTGTARGGPDETPGGEDRTDAPSRSGGRTWRRALDVAVSVESDEPRCAAEVERVFGSLPTDVGGEAAGGPATRLAYRLRVDDGATIDIQLDGRSVGGANSVAAALSYAQWHLNQEVIAHSSDRALLHAGAVRRPGGGLVVLPGQTNAGKSTLTAGLVRAGWGYLTDELVGITPGTGEAGGYRKALSLDPGAWPLFPEAAPASTPTRTDAAPAEPAQPGASPAPGPDGPTPGEWLVDPRALHPDALDGPPQGEVVLVVFPRFETGAVTAAESLSPARALVELLRHRVGGDPIDPAEFDTLVDLARRVPTFVLTTGGLSPAVERVATLATPGAHP